MEGGWLQPELRNFSKPELRIFSWGFEKEALFAAKVKKTGSEKVARIGIKAQACTETICKDISKELELDLGLAAGPADRSRRSSAIAPLLKLSLAVAWTYRQDRPAMVWVFSGPKSRFTS